MRSYGAARTLFSIVAFIAWSIIIIGVLTALGGGGAAAKFGNAGAGLFAMVPGISITIAGIFILVFVQIGRAGVDTAEYTQQMLKISRDQLEVSRQALSHGKIASKSFSSLAAKPISEPKTASFSEPAQARKPTPAPAPEPERLVDQKIDYHGRVIISNGQTHRVAHAEFKQLEHAKAHIDLLVQKDELAAKVEALSAVKIPNLDPVLSTRDPMRLQTGAAETAPKSQRREPRFK